MLAIAIVFAILFLAVAALLTVLSIHGPDSLPFVAVVYLVAANGVWWWSFVQFRRRGFRTLYFLLEGLGLIAMGGAFGATSYLVSDLYERYKTTQTKITEVSDELLLSENGHPMGIRLQFTAEFPVRDYFYIQPYLSPARDYSSKIRERIPARSYNPSPLRMQVIAKSVEPFPAGADREEFERYQGQLGAFGLVFEKEVPYRFRFDVAPTYLRRVERGQGYCIAHPTERNWRAPREVFDALIQVDLPTKYEVWISGTAYGSRRWDSEQEQTANEYIPKSFYEGVMAENFKACDPSQFVVY